MFPNKQIIKQNIEANTPEFKAFFHKLLDSTQKKGATFVLAGMIALTTFSGPLHASETQNAKTVEKNNPSAQIDTMAEVVNSNLAIFQDVLKDINQNTGENHKATVYMINVDKDGKGHLSAGTQTMDKDGGKFILQVSYTNGTNAQSVHKIEADNAKDILFGVKNVIKSETTKYV